MTTIPADKILQSTTEYWSDTGAQLLYSIASVLNEPICRARELYYMAEVIPDIYPDTSKTYQLALSSLSYLGAFFAASAACITTIPALLFSGLAANLQQRPFMYRAGNGEEKEISDDKCTLLTWNVCGVPAGHSITDGGVLPWASRIDQIIQTIEKADADVVCLNEVFNISLSETLYTRLKSRYPHFYLNIGPRTVALPSGLFVISRLPLQNPAFVAFPKETLVETTKFAEKGYFSFDVASREKTYCRLFVSHPQHSEEVSRPTPDERKAREAQMLMIRTAMKAESCALPILTGDLNFDDEEFKEASWGKHFEEGKREYSRPTWNGDGYCAKLMGKDPSTPCNLDHVLMLKERLCSIITKNIETGFDGKYFRPKALSDHEALLSTITFTS